MACDKFPETVLLGASRVKIWITWAPTSNPVLGVISGVKGQELNRETYPLLLGRRLQILAENAEDEELSQATDLLLEAGLISEPLSRERAGLEISNSPELLSELRKKGVPGRMPAVLETNDQKAASLSRETSLLEWTFEAVSGRIERG